MRFKTVLCALAGASMFWFSPAEAADEIVVGFATAASGFMQAYDKPANALEFKIDRDTDGALRNQVYILGHFDLEEDQALVIDVNVSGAGYFISPITNYWGTTNDIVHRTSCLNQAQSVANADGTVCVDASKVMGKSQHLLIQEFR